MTDKPGVGATTEPPAAAGRWWQNWKWTSFRDYRVVDGWAKVTRR